MCRNVCFHETAFRHGSSKTFANKASKSVSPEHLVSRNAFSFWILSTVIDEKGAGRLQKTAVGIIIANARDRQECHIARLHNSRKSEFLWFLREQLTEKEVKTLTENGQKY